MNAFLTALLTSLSGQILNTLNIAMSSASEIFKYLNGKRKDKKEKEAIKNQEKLENIINDISDNGNLKDLIDIGDRIK